MESKPKVIWITQLSMALETDGSMCIGSNGIQNGQRFYTPIFAFTNSIKELVDEVEKIMWNLGLKTSRTKSPDQWTRNAMFYVRAKGMRNLLPVLKMLEPHLLTHRRKRQAKLMIEFIERRLSRSRHKAPLLEEEIEIIKEVSSLNKKGREIYVK